METLSSKRESVILAPFRSGQLWMYYEMHVILLKQELLTARRVHWACYVINDPDTDGSWLHQRHVITFPIDECGRARSMFGARLLSDVPSDPDDDKQA